MGTLIRQLIFKVFIISLCMEVVETAEAAAQAERNKEMRIKLKAARSSSVEAIRFESPTFMSVPTQAKIPPWFLSGVSTSLPRGAFFIFLHAEIAALSKWLRPTRSEISARTKIEQNVRLAVSKLSKNADILPFGSVATDLCLPHSDIDFAVVGMEFSSFSKSGKTAVMKRLANTLIDMKLARGRLEVVDTARVPVVKFVSIEGVSVDIAFGNDKQPRRTSEWIKAQISRFPSARPLILFLKIFLAERKLNEPFYGGVGSYLLVVLVVAFLKNHNCMKNMEIYSQTSLGHLIFDFFRFFGDELDERKVGISSNGGLQPRKHRGDGLSVENPDEVWSDIGSAAWDWSRIKSCFKNTYLCLCEMSKNFKNHNSSILAVPALLGVSLEWADRNFRNIPKKMEKNIPEIIQIDPPSIEADLDAALKIVAKKINGKRKYVEASDSEGSHRNISKTAKIDVWSDYD